MLFLDYLLTFCLNLKLYLPCSCFLRYLEELSQRYRKRMEDMYKSLNRTIQKLQNMSASAEVQDRKQQERIRTLEGVVESINASVLTLQSRVDLVHEEVKHCKQLVFVY